MNKFTVKQLFKRAYERELRDLNDAGWKARNEIEQMEDLQQLSSQIHNLKTRREALLAKRAAPLIKRSDKAKLLFKKRYSELNNQLGFAITVEEKQAAVLAIKNWLKALPNCPEAKLL